MTFPPGTDVIVSFKDHEAHGVVLSHVRGWVMAQIATDPEWDYGVISARLAPHSTVCVPERDVRERLGSDSPGVLAAP